VTHYEVIIFIGYLAIYIKPFFHYIVFYIESWCCTILNLHCSFVVFIIMMPLMHAVYPFILFPPNIQ